jgi:hypothetical protein
MLNNMTKKLKELFEMILFLFLVIITPLWILPYTLVIKHKEKKYESRDNK